MNARRWIIAIAVVAVGIVLWYWPASPVKTRRLVLVVIDSHSSLDSENSGAFQIYPTVSHGGMVREVMRKYGGYPDEVVVHDADDRKGGIDYHRYISALEKTNQFASEHPGQALVLNLSLGSFESNAREHNLINSLLERGVIVVAGAGNHGTERPFFPASYPGVVAVAASDGGRRASYSSYGEHIAVVADGTVKKEQMGSKFGEFYSREIQLNGTSFASPRVAGVLGELLRRSTPDEAVEILRRSAVPMKDPQFAEGKLGAGLLSPHRALSSVEPGYWFRKWAWLVAPFAGLFFLQAQSDLDTRFTLSAYFSLTAWCLVVLGVSYSVVRVFCPDQSPFMADVFVVIGLISFFVLAGFVAWIASYVGAWADTSLAAQDAVAVTRRSDVKWLRSLVAKWRKGACPRIDRSLTLAVGGASGRDLPLLTEWFHILASKGYSDRYAPQELEPQLGLLKARLVEERGLTQVRRHIPSLIKQASLTPGKIDALARDIATFEAAIYAYLKEEATSPTAPTSVFTQSAFGLSNALKYAEEIEESLMRIEDTTRELIVRMTALHESAGDVDGSLEKLADSAANSSDVFRRFSVLVRKTKTLVNRLAERPAQVQSENLHTENEADESTPGRVNSWDSIAVQPMEYAPDPEWTNLEEHARRICHDVDFIINPWRSATDNVRVTLDHCMEVVESVDGIQLDADYWQNISRALLMRMTHTPETFQLMIRPLWLAAIFLLAPIWGVPALIISGSVANSRAALVAFGLLAIVALAAGYFTWILR